MLKRRSRFALPRFTGGAVKVNLGFLDIEGNWEPDERERYAAWEMYVELVTRISVVELKSNEGLLREALSSLYTLFNTTREILKKYGPGVAQSKGEGDISFGRIAVEVLNVVLRPVLAYWHPILLDYESGRDTSVSATQHEWQWDKAEDLREKLNEVRTELIAYANTLACVADVP